MYSINLDLNLKVTDLNSDQPSLFGLANEDIIGLDCSIVFEKLNSNAVISFYQWILQNKSSNHFAYEQTISTGEYVVLDSYRLHNRISIIINIRKSLNIKETFNKRFKAFFLDNFEGGVLFLDFNGILLDSTEGITKLFKFKDHNKVQISREAMIDRSFFSILDNNNFKNISELLKKMIDLVKREAEGKLSDDVNILNNICQLYVSPFYVQKQILGYYIYVHDLTILRQKDRLIESQIASLVSSSKLASLGAMAGGIAHEINNPITVIQGVSRIFRKYIEKGIFDPHKFNKGCDQIDKTVDRISKIVSGLRTVSRDTSNEDFLPCKISDIMDDVLALCSEKFKFNKIPIKLDLSDEVYQTVIQCRRVQLSQVFLNLLGNSFDAIEALEDRWVQVKCEKNKKNITLRFIDSGSGIPKEIQDKMLNPFFTTKEVGKGTGLGLSLSNSYIKNHNGELIVDNNFKNTCFVVTLPLSGGLNA
ncbi:MAG: ATP-binding protein [Pseudobdellovibrio sp.]